MRWFRTRLEGWRRRAQIDWARVQVRRASLACLDADRYALGAVIELAWRVDQAEGLDGSQRGLALLLLRRDLEQLLDAQPSADAGRRAG